MLNSLVNLRLAEINHFVTTFDKVRGVFPTATAWKAGQYILLSLQVNGPIPVKALIFDMRRIMSEASAHRLIRQVNKAGLIQMDAAKDRRSRLCSLTEKGTELVVEVICSRKKLMEQRGVSLPDPIATNSHRCS